MKKEFVNELLKVENKRVLVSIDANKFMEIARNVIEKDIGKEASDLAYIFVDDESFDLSIGFKDWDVKEEDLDKFEPYDVYGGYENINTVMESLFGEFADDIFIFVDSTSLDNSTFDVVFSFEYEALGNIIKLLV